MAGKIIEEFKSINIAAWILIIIGTIVWSLTMVKSGIIYPFGMGFWGPNGHDGVWHIALAQGLAKGSWEMPVYAGETIKNYHIGFDLVLAALHKLTFIPIYTLYFQIIPPVLALLIGFFAYKFVYLWRKSSLQAFWATFFVYFGGNWGWIVTLLRRDEIGGESMFWSQQSISTLINPPFALSLLFLFAGLYFLIKGLRIQKSHATSYFLPATFLFGVLVQIKVYAGMLSLAGLFVAGIWRMLKRKGIVLLKVFTGSLIVAILIFSPVSQGVGQTIIFKPFWFLEEMVSSPDRFYWPKMASALSNYKLVGNWIKATLAYGLLLFIFWFGNVGTRVIKDIELIKRLKKIRDLDYLEIIIYTIVGLGVLIPLFFIQSGTPWNTIQFMYYSLMFSGILAGIALGEFLEKSNTTLLRSAVVTILVLLTIPTTLGTLWNHYLPSRPPAKISREELEALEFLSKQPDGVVLTQPFDKKAAEAALSNPPRPLYLYESTAYVSAFSGKSVYLEDEVNLEITGYGWRKRRSELEKFIYTGDLNVANDFLKNNNITYVYWIKNLRGPISDEQNVVDKIFENDAVQIFKVN